MCFFVFHSYVRLSYQRLLLASRRYCNSLMEKLCRLASGGLAWIVRIVSFKKNWFVFWRKKHVFMMRYHETCRFCHTKNADVTMKHIDLSVNNTDSGMVNTELPIT